MHIKSLNFKSRAELIEKNVTYKNEFAIFGEDGKVPKFTKLIQQTIWSTKDQSAIDSFKLHGTIDQTKFNKVNYKKAVLATGTRPTRISEEVIPGISHAIDSDDVFFLKQLPKKAIVIGGRLHFAIQFESD